jgi:ketosteroid isomerase-like protein
VSQEATTPDLVEHTRRSYESFSRRDLDGVMHGYDRDVVFDMSPVGLGSFEGQAAVRGFLEDWRASYEELVIDLEEVHDLGHGVVFAVVRQNARLAHSTGNVRLHHANVFVWVEGLIVRVTHYNDIDEAREAAERLAESTE